METLKDGSLVDFDGDCARKVEQEVLEHGGGDAPQLGLTAASVGPAAPVQDEYRIPADGGRRGPL
ncbi:hypothetical protein D1J63_09555 [Streptomyces sp. KPB2]|uniref:hypothetical protein n=1 Tax=Streptomyces TaxID=1883 RepID=UPI000F6C3930|nr:MULTISPECIES: hypothetical protein [unclassified Streptomyces]AZM75182.1 hypothetical protein D1J63_09555 [Streptomyces sp. KPB2]QKW60697.1 hypothetical protein HUT15_09290 [Streptomyces sp. NA03103]